MSTDGLRTSDGVYAIHPLAAELPLLEGEERTALEEDIRLHGLRLPIVLTQDRSTLVDGRNRYEAALKAGREPTIDTLPEDYTEDQIAEYIHSVNGLRRHLDSDARRAFRDEVIADASTPEVADDRRVRYLTRTEKQRAVRNRLLEDSTRSDRSIADQLGVSPTPWVRFAGSWRRPINCPKWTVGSGRMRGSAGSHSASVKRADL